MRAQSQRAGGRLAIALFLVLWLGAVSAQAQEPAEGVTGSTPDATTSLSGTLARDALELVFEAARAWSPDAALVYVENDESLGVNGRSARWGYVFLSPASKRARVYSVRGGEIVLAEFLDFDLEAPSLPDTWIDSAQAIAEAEAKAGASFREKVQGEVGTALLMRGGFDEKKPDITTWTVVYTAPGQPSLFVVVDAANGKVLRTWRG
jgi:hypothetical protein